MKWKMLSSVVMKDEIVCVPSFSLSRLTMYFHEVLKLSTLQSIPLLLTRQSTALFIIGVCY
jgi:hypothetical protein